MEAYNSICNLSKDQINDARHKANLVEYKGGSTKDTCYFQLIITVYMREPLTLYTPNNHIFEQMFERNLP